MAKTGQSVKKLGLSVRSYNFLRRSGIDTVDQLIRISEDELLDLPGMGPQMLQDIKDRLKANRKKLLFRTRVDRLRSDLWSGR